MKIIQINKMRIIYIYNYNNYTFFTIAYISNCNKCIIPPELTVVRV